jgi:hypothetical protein
MICPRCKKIVPEAQLACTCFIRRAEVEKRTLAIQRFTNGEIILFVRDGHIFPERSKSLSLCGTASINAANQDRTEQLSLEILDRSKVEPLPKPLKQIKCDACWGALPASEARH